MIIIVLDQRVQKLLHCSCSQELRERIFATFTRKYKAFILARHAKLGLLESFWSLNCSGWKLSFGFVAVLSKKNSKSGTLEHRIKAGATTAYEFCTYLFAFKERRMSLSYCTAVHCLAICEWDNDHLSSLPFLFLGGFSTGTTGLLVLYTPVQNFPHDNPGISDKAEAVISLGTRDV